MTEANTRVRFIRTSLYEHRECWTCIRARRRARQATPESLAAKRAYQRAKRDGTYAPKGAPIIGAEERAVLEARHAARIAEVGYDWARKRKSKAVRLREAATEREQAAEVVLAAERAAELLRARQDPELAALIDEQTRDGRTFKLVRTGRFVPQGMADRLFYGELDYWKVEGRMQQDVSRSYARVG